MCSVTIYHRSLQSHGATYPGVYNYCTLQLSVLHYRWTEPVTVTPPLLPPTTPSQLMEVKKQNFKEKKKDAGTRDRGKTKDITLKNTHTNNKYINNTFEFT